MKPTLLLLPAALLLAACGAAPSSSSAVPAQSAAPAASASQSPETAAATIDLTVDYSAYYETVEAAMFRGDPDFCLDAAGSQSLEIADRSYDGAQVTYRLAGVPDGTTDLYVARPVRLAVPEVVGEQTLPAVAGASCEDFTVQDVQLTNDGALEVVVTLDPASAAFPTRLTIDLEGVYDPAGISIRTQWGEDNVAETMQWYATFTVNSRDATMEQVQAALPAATLHWNTVERYVQVTDAPCLTEGITLHWPGAE